MCPDIVSANSMSVACCCVASPGGWDPEGLKGLPVGPPQELEVGARRAPYILVDEYFISVAEL